MSLHDTTYGRPVNSAPHHHHHHHHHQHHHHTIALNCTPPPAYHNINLPPGHPANLINDRGAPPSYDEVIDPNGKFHFFYFPPLNNNLNT